MEYLITPQPAGFVPPQCFEIFTLPFPLCIGNGTVSTNALSLCDAGVPRHSGSSQPYTCM